MLSSAIKSDSFTSYKKIYFCKMKSLGKRKVLYFCFRLLSRKCVYKVFDRNISGIVTDHVKVILNFFRREFYHKNQVHRSHHAASNIFQKSVIILTFHIFIWNLIRVCYLRIYLVKQIWIYGLNLNSRKKTFLNIKLLGKGIQEKLYFNNIVSTKSTFLANWVKWKT